jgi:Prolyl oligopeptidase family
MKARLERIPISPDEEVRKKKTNIDKYFNNRQEYVKNEWIEMSYRGKRSDPEELTKYASEIAKKSLAELENNKYSMQNLLFLLTNLDDINMSIAEEKVLLEAKEKIIEQLGILLSYEDIPRDDVREIIASGHLSAILKKLGPQKNNIVVKNISIAALSNEKDVVEFFRSKQTPHPETESSFKKHGLSKPKVTVITPIHPYHDLDAPPIGIKQIEGKSLPDNSENKLNYHIHFPENKPKAVVVWVYGGCVFEDRRMTFHPNKLTDIDKALLNDDIAIAKLNTREAEHFSMYENQTMLSAEGHKELHGDIHRFYEILKNNPSTLNEECSILSDIPIFIIGHSFGGRTAVRHVQLYPQDFDGAISINGGLSFKTIKKHDPQDKYAQRWLDVDRAAAPKGTHPSKAMDWLSPPVACKMEKPILVIHNVLDTNANVYNSISFFRRAKKLDSNLSTYLFAENLHVKENHEIPAEKSKHFKILTDKITDFTTKVSDTDISTGISPDEAAVMMAKYYPKKSVMNRFISHSYWLAQKNPLDERAKSVIDHWETDYKPILAAVLYIDDLAKLSKEDKIKKIKTDFENIITIPDSFLQDKVVEFLQNKFGKLTEDNLISTSDIQQFSSIGISGLKDIILRSIDKFADSERNNFLIDLYSALPELKERLLNDKDLASTLREISDNAKNQLHDTLIDLSTKSTGNFFRNPVFSC